MWLLHQRFGYLRGLGYQVSSIPADLKVAIDLLAKNHQARPLSLNLRSTLQSMTHVQQSKNHRDLYYYCNTGTKVWSHHLQPSNSYKQLHTICPKMWNMKQPHEKLFVNAEKAIDQRSSKPWLVGIY